MERDQKIFDLIEAEHQRQLKGIELIASENFVSDEVIEGERSLVIPEAANREISCQVVLKRILESLA